METKGVPTKQVCEALARKTGESVRKCYFWLLAKERDQDASSTQEEMPIADALDTSDPGFISQPGLF